MVVTDPVYTRVCVCFVCVPKLMLVTVRIYCTLICTGTHIKLCGINKCTCVDTWMHTLVYMRVHSYVHTCTHAHTHTHTRTHTHEHAHAGKTRRITFIECPPDLHGMLDAAKYADLVLLMIDGAFGFEMETFEFLNLLQVSVHVDLICSLRFDICMELSWSFRCTCSNVCLWVPCTKQVSDATRIMLAACASKLKVQKVVPTCS